MSLDSVMTARVEAFVQKRTPTWTRWLQQLVRIPSPYEHEMPAMRKVEQILRGLGVTHLSRISHEAKGLARLAAAQKPFSRTPGRYSLVATVPADSLGRSLILNAHVDTVESGAAQAWSHPPFSGHIDQQKKLLFGRGSMDDKAGVVIALAVLDLVLKGPLRLRGELQVHLVLEDEITGNGSLLCLKAGHRANAAVIIDGTRLDRAINEHAGQLQFSVTAFGAPTSVSVSHLGTNAAELVAELAAVLKRKVRALNRTRSKRWRIYPSPFQCSLQNVICQTETFTIPAQATGQWYLTFCGPFNLKRMLRQIEQWVSEFAADRKLPVVPKVEIHGYATEPVLSRAASLEKLLKTQAEVRGFEPIAIGPSTGTSDLRHYAAAGIPCLLYGPGRGYQPHRPNEYYHLDDLPRMVGLYAAMTSAWCGVEPGTKR